MTSKNISRKTAKPAPAKSSRKAAPKKKAPAKKTSARPAARKAPRKRPPATPPEELIAQAAYFNFLHRVENGVPGDAVGDWLAAESTFRAA